MLRELGENCIHFFTRFAIIVISGKIIKLLSIFVVKRLKNIQVVLAIMFHRQYTLKLTTVCCTNENKIVQSVSWFQLLNLNGMVKHLTVFR